METKIIEVSEYIETFETLENTKKILIRRIESCQTREELWKMNSDNTRFDLICAKKIIGILID